MIIGIPKEIWRDERRVALTPAGVYSLVRSGHKVVIEADAGNGSGFSRESYEQAGATIAFSAEEVFARADFVIKIMPPASNECEWLGEKKLLFSFVQRGISNPSLLRQLMERKVTAVGYELIVDKNQNFPALTAMSEIAGMLLPQIAGRFLETTYGGRGIALSGVTGIPASSVVIIGAGMVGATAARSFLGVGANVMVLDSDLERLRNLETSLNKMVNTALANKYNLEKYVEFADVLIGAVYIPGQEAPHVITETMVRKMKPGSVLMDVSIDQGGCAETSRPTSLSDPIFIKHGVVHYCVPNIASSVARTACHALNNVLLSYVEEVANHGLQALVHNAFLRQGVYLFDGFCTHSGLAELLNIDYTDPQRIQALKGEL